MAKASEQSELVSTCAIILRWREVCQIAFFYKVEVNKKPMITFIFAFFIGYFFNDLKFAFKRLKKKFDDIT